MSYNYEILELRKRLEFQGAISKVLAVIVVMEALLLWWAIDYYSARIAPGITRHVHALVNIRGTEIYIDDGCTLDLSRPVMHVTPTTERIK